MFYLFIALVGHWLRIYKKNGAVISSIFNQACCRIYLKALPAAAGPTPRYRSPPRNPPLLPFSGFQGRSDDERISNKGKELLDGVEEENFGILRSEIACDREE